MQEISTKNGSPFRLWPVFALSVVFGVGTLAAGRSLVRSTHATRHEGKSALVGRQVAKGEFSFGKSKLYTRDFRGDLGEGGHEREGASEIGEEKGEFKEAKEAYWHARAWPDPVYDSRRTERAIAHIRRMPTVATRTSNGGGNGGGNTGRVAPPINGSSGQPLIPAGAKWEFLGPRNAKTLSIKPGLGPANSYVIGRVNHVAYDPKSPRTIYLASAGGGIWRSLDSGVNWTPVTDTVLDRLETTCVAVHPTTTKTILAGLGDYHGFGVPGGGIARSTNGGQTWSVIGGVVNGLSISAIEFDPDSPNTVIASAGRGFQQGGVFRSVNGGLSWGAVNSASGGDWTSVTIGAKDPATGTRTYYAAKDGDGVYRSDDRGLTWAKIPAPLRYVGQGAGATGIEVAASKFEPSTVYVSEGSASAQDGRIFKSAAKGIADSWTDISGQHPAVSDTGTPWTQVWYDHHLATSFAIVDGNVKDIVYQGLLSVYGNVGGGAFWSNITRSYTNQTRAHTDQQGMGVNPLNPNETIIANDGGIYGMVFNPSTKAWTLDKGTMNQTLGVSQFYGADWHPSNPNIMVGGTQDNSTFATYGNLFDWRNENGGDGFSAAIHQTQPRFMMSTSQFGTLYLTPNGGSDWFGTSPNDGSEPFPFDSQIAVESNVIGDDVFYPGLGVDSMPIVYDGGQSLWRFGVVENNTIWQKLGSDKLNNGDANAVITAIAVAPKDPNIIVVGSSDGSVWITYNAMFQDFFTGEWVPSAATDVDWIKVNASPIKSLPAGQVNCISINPARPDDITVGIGGAGTEHVWRLVVQLDIAGNLLSGWTPQAGIQGTPSSLPDTPVLSITRDPFDSDSSFYVGTDMGVFGTGDNGSTWANLSRPYGLPNAIVNEIKGNRQTGYLNVATFGRGMWRLKLADTSGFDLGVNAGVTRQAGVVKAKVSLTNNSTGDLDNARITEAYLRIDRVANAITTTTTLPLAISPLLAEGLSASGTVDFSDPSLRPGTVANLTILAQAEFGTETKTVTKTFLVRLP